MRAKASGEQAIAVGVVHDIAWSGAGAGERARHEVGPGFDVGLGVADDRRLSGRAGRGVYAQQFFTWYSKHSERIVVAQVGLLGERKAREIGQDSEVGRFHAGGVECLAEMRNV